MTIWGQDTTHPALLDGHHRVAAAADIEKTTGHEVYVPVDDIKDVPVKRGDW